jgi:hypothetical protein
MPDTSKTALIQAETLPNVAKSRARIKHRPARSDQPVDGSQQNGQDRFFRALQKSAREMKSAGKKLDADDGKTELMQKVIGSYLVSQTDVLYVYRKSVRVLISVLKVSQEVADRFTREMILKSVEMALAKEQSNS